ncbi:MAG TPA: CpaF/VirB11 family protein [Propionibacteriaceae bacterium]|nr:CpaF/VirB11 family protein [Propionibacteriaceae bacterium]
MSAPNLTRDLADLPGHRLADLRVAAAASDVPTATLEPGERRPGRGGVPASRDTGVDWDLVVRLRRIASEEITAASATYAAEHQRPMAPDDRRALGRSIIRRVVRHHAETLVTQGQALWPLELEHAHATAVDNAIFGYGRLQPLFEIPTAENIEIHGFDSVVVQHGDGHRETHPPVADSDEELVEAIRFLGETTTPTRPFDDAHPMMTMALGARFRLHAIGFGLSYRPSVVIRQHILTAITLRDLAAGGMMPPEVARLLHDCVLARKSMVVSGDQGAGKTTLLRGLIAAIPHTERFGTLETDYELLTHLLPGRRNILALQAKTGVGELHEGRSLGEYSVADLIPETLRQNLSRLVVGEVRGSEAGAMFEAMQSGQGTLSTTHSHSAASTIDRLASRVAQGGVLTVAEAYRQIAHNIHVLVHVKLDDDTWRGGVRRRYVSEIRVLTGAMEGERPVTHLVYRAASPGRPAELHPYPPLEEELGEFRGVWERAS